MLPCSFDRVDPKTPAPPVQRHRTGGGASAYATGCIAAPSSAVRCSPANIKQAKKKTLKYQ